MARSLPSKDFILFLDSFMHLSHIVIESNLKCIEGIRFISMCVPSQPYTILHKTNHNLSVYVINLLMLS